MYIRIYFLSCFLLLSCAAHALEFSCIVRNADGVEFVVQEDDRIVCQEGENIAFAKKSKKDFEGEFVTIPMPDGNPIQGSFFDRKSDILIVMGPGFGYYRQTLNYYAKIFHNYDVLIFDYRWRSNIQDFLFSMSTLRGPMSALFKNPKDEVASVVRFGRLHKSYKQVIGLGVCYSAFQFLSAQVESNQRNMPLFDKLILDSCPLSTADVEKNLFCNMSLIFKPWQDDKPGFFQSLWTKTCIPDLMSWFFSKISNYSAVPLCQLIGDMPVLCIHGKADRLVPLASFERLWVELKTPNKQALITPNSHVLNIQRQAIYKVVCDRFIDPI